MSQEDDRSAQEAFIASLPSNLQTQLKNGIADVGNVPMEALRRMAVEASVDGAIGNLEGAANRGDANAHPLNWISRTDIGGAEPADHNSITVPSGLPANNTSKDGNDLPPRK